MHASEHAAVVGSDCSGDLDSVVSLCSDSVRTITNAAKTSRETPIRTTIKSPGLALFVGPTFIFTLPELPNE
jgi:hypothetical protein